MDIQKLVNEAQSGDEAAFGVLYDQLYNKLYGYTYKKTFDQHSAADITSNTFVKMIQNLPKFTWVNESAFYGWVFRICSAEVSNYFKKQNKYCLNSEYFDDDTCDLFEDIKQSTTAERIDKDLDKIRLHKALSGLKDHEQEIVEMHYLAGMSHREIAQIKEMREGNVRVIAHRAVKKLQGLINIKEYELITERVN